MVVKGCIARTKFIYTQFLEFGLGLTQPYQIGGTSNTLPHV